MSYLMPAVVPEQNQQRPWLDTLVKILAVAGLVYAGCAIADAMSSKPERICGRCGRPGHDRRTCSYDVPREAFSRAIPKSRRCECCGLYGYNVERHHTRGRGNTGDYLDLCDGCHIECGHGGDFQNLAIKPRVCRRLNRTSFWCG